MTVSMLLCAAITQSTPAPRVVFNSFLERTSFFLQGADPMVRINTMQIAFPPSEQFKTKCVIKSGDQVLGETEFRDHMAVRAGSFAEVGATKSSQPLGTTDGKRTIEVYVNDALAGKFEFTLTKTSNGDPLDPKVTWKMVGPWKDYAFLKHRPDDGYRQDLILTYWVAEHELTGKEKIITTTIKKGATVVATDPKRYPNGPGYSRFEMPLMRANRNPITVKDLPSMAGTYTVEVKEGARMLRNWTFTIANGAVVAHPRSDFNKTEAIAWLPTRKQNGNQVDPFTMFWLGPK
ncbi:MAG: hypothetical protein KDC26_09755 [Armatimonadetes bacterium]|nr:hypothetical protein [Armatimonadota bacterium]